MKKFDLTTIKGAKLAKGYANYLKHSTPLGLGISFLEKLLARNENIEKNQKEFATALIRKGKEEGVDEMEITVNNFSGGKLDIPIEDVNINCALGAEDKMIVKVKYK